jgi:Ca-activated chloride channel family protein
VRVDVDEKTLQKIAEMTSGQYFRATNNRSLKAIYNEIDEMEKTRIEVKAYRSYAEMFYMWAFAGLAALLLEFTLSSMILRKVP